MTFYASACAVSNAAKVTRWIVLAVTALLPVTVYAAQHDAAGSHGVIVVNGSGHINVVPDEVRFVVGIDAKAPTAQQAYDQVEEKMQRAIKVLKRLDVASEQIQAMSLTLNPVVDYKQRDRIIAHDARRDIAVKVDDMKTYAQAMQQLAEIEITRFQQVTLSSSQQQKLEIEALEKALQNARQKAKRLASVSSKSLGSVVEIVEHGASRLPSMPRAFQRSGAVAMAAESQAQGTVSSGLIRINASVSATFTLN